MRNVIVLVIEKRRSMVMLPDREVDLGVLAPGVRIAMEQVMMAHGPGWQPRVMGASETER